MKCMRLIVIEITSMKRFLAVIESSIKKGNMDGNTVKEVLQNVSRTTKTSVGGKKDQLSLSQIDTTRIDKAHLYSTEKGLKFKSS